MTGPLAYFKISVAL